MSQLMRKLMGRVYRDVEGEEGSAGGGAPAVESVPASGNDVNTDWGAMADDSDDGAGTDGGEFDAGEGAAPATPPAEPVASPADPAAPAEPAAPTAPAPQQPAQPAPQTPPPAQQPTAEAPAANPAAAPDVAVMRQQYHGELEKFYAFDPETAQKLLTEPEVVLPKLAATLHMEVMDAVMSQLPARMGAFIQEHEEFSRRETEAKDSFFTAFPELRNYEAQVLQVGQMFRAANPQATKDQTIQAIGKIVMESLGITRAAPAAPTQSPVPPPFVPAQSAGGGAAPAPARSTWDDMIEPD
jgi:hypothetical protein